MRYFKITEYELNAIADHLNSCEDKDRAMLRPSREVINRAWAAANAIKERPIPASQGDTPKNLGESPASLRHRQNP